MSNHCYRFKKTESKKLDVRFLHITHAHCSFDRHITAQRHPFIELFYVLQGNGCFLIEDEKLPVTENDLIVIKPNISHIETCDADHSMEYIALGISDLVFKEEEKNTASGYSIHHFQTDKEDFVFYMKMLLKEANNREEGFETICQNLLESLLLTLIRRTHSTISVASSRKTMSECRFVEQYIDEHFTENVTLQRLSELTSLNKYYLVHSFKKYKGTSPINYLISRRIMEAKQLLKTTNYSVAKIAATVGFSSQSYFSQVFKRETNMTPNAWRKSNNSISN